MHIRNPIEWLFGQADLATENVGAARPAEYWTAPRAQRAPSVREISADDLRQSLRLGLKDFAAARTDVAFLCLIYPVIGLFLAVVTARGGLIPLMFPIASGFTLVGPFAALGLYEISRRREMTGSANWLAAFQVWRSPAIGSICLLGAMLIGLFLLWLVAAVGIYDATLGPATPASAAAFIHAVFTTPAGWAMIAAGLAVGSVFAVAALAISVVSFPMLLDRPVRLGTAIQNSVYAVRRNPGTLAIWGLIIAIGLFLGSLPCFLGLIVVLPVLGHSTWHLYRRLIRR
jgi:uncharacterized membrane protein